MQAVVVPALHSKWELKDIPTPKPGPNQVLIKMHASGICYTDVHMTEGLLPAQFPNTIGHEPVGEIVELGDAVTTRKIGDRVGVPWVQHTCGRCEWCQRGKTMFCLEQIGTGVNIAEGHAEYMVAYANATQLLPEGLSYERASARILCRMYSVQRFKNCRTPTT